jgi:lauroyl/myristoyl acyltransferase
MIAFSSIYTKLYINGMGLIFVHIHFFNTSLVKFLMAQHEPFVTEETQFKYSNWMVNCKVTIVNVYF